LKSQKDFSPFLIIILIFTFVENSLIWYFLDIPIKAKRKNLLQIKFVESLSCLKKGFSIARVEESQVYYVINRKKNIKLKIKQFINTKRTDSN